MLVVENGYHLNGCGKRTFRLTRARSIRRFLPQRCRVRLFTLPRTAPHPQQAAQSARENPAFLETPRAESWVVPARQPHVLRRTDVRARLQERKNGPVAQLVGSRRALLQLFLRDRFGGEILFGSKNVRINFFHILFFLAILGFAAICCGPPSEISICAMICIFFNPRATFPCFADRPFKNPPWAQGPSSRCFPTTTNERTATTSSAKYKFTTSSSRASL